MPKHESDPPAPAPHAEGQHGDKTHGAFLQQLHSKANGPGDPDAPPDPDFDEFGQPHPGKHRLTEDRQQHDAAEKNSEANRLGR